MTHRSRFRHSFPSNALLFVFFALVVFFAVPSPTSAAIRTWDNDNGNGNWSTAANWSGDTVPGLNDIAYFGTTSTANSSVDSSFVGRVNAIMVAPGYTGTITLGRALSVGTGGIVLSGGTLDVAASNYQLSVSGSFVNVAGTFVERQGTLVLGGTRTDHTLREPGVLNNVTINDGLVGYWKFDDATGLTATDSTGNGNNGTLTNMQSGSDWVSSNKPSRMQTYNQTVIDCDGTNDYVNLGLIPALQGSKNFTIAFWVYRSSAVMDRLFGKGAASSDVTISWWNDSKVYLDIGNASQRAITAAVTSGQWRHMAFTLSNGTSRVFIDGVQSATVAEPDGITAHATNVFGLCARGNSSDQYAAALFDELRVYKRALSRTEIQNLYNGYPHTGSGVYSLGSPLNVSGSLLNYTAELRTGNAYPVTLSGNLLNLGQFTSTGTVYLRGGTNQTMSGNTVFQNLDIRSNGRTRTIFMDHSSRQSVSGSLVLQGTVGNTLTLRSTRTGSAANLLLDGDNGTQSIEYVNVKDNDASGGGTLYCYTTTEGCTDAGNTTNWSFSAPVGAHQITGTVYTNEGTTVIGANKTVAVSLNGGTTFTTDDSDSGGQYSVTGLTMTGGTIVTLYVDDETEDAVLVTLGSGSSMTGIHLYQDRLILRSDSGSHAMTNARLAIADNIGGSGDSDISALYLMADSNATLQVKPDKELYVWQNDTFTPGGRVKSHDVEVKGTLAMGTNGLTVSGSLVANAGTLTTSTGVILRSLTDAPGETLSLGNNVIKDLIISDDSLIGYWKLDDANGGTAKDSSGRGNNGTLTNMETGADWVTTGLPSQMTSFNHSALDFDGSNDYVSFGSMGAAGFPGTLSFWIKPDSVAGGDVRILGNAGGNCGGIIRASTTSLQTINLGCSAWSTIATGLSTADWQHIAVTFDGTNATGYRNGVAGSAYNIGGSPNFWVGQTWTVATPYSGFGTYYDGKMDDIRVYNRVLSNSEIQNLYNGSPHTGSGIYSLGSKLNVSGSLLNYTGELRTGNAYPVTLSGNLLNFGQFTSTGTVYLRGGTNQTMSGGTVFQNLDIRSNGRTRTIFLDHSSRQSVSGSLVLLGTASNTLTLRSTRTGSAANLLLDGDSGTQSIEYLDVKDNDASGGGTLYCYTASEGCTNAGNTTNWTFANVGSSITGTVYTNEGTTVIGANKTVAVSLNGGAASTTDDTDAGGQYSVTGLVMTGGTILTLYLDDETEDAVMITLGSGSNMTGMHLYQDRLITRSDSGSHVMTNARLAIADNNADTDISALYLMADSNATLQVKPDKELYVWSGDTFTPGGRVKSHDIEVKGTLAMGTNGLAVSGSLVANAGTLTTSTGVILRSFSDGPGETLSLGNNVIKDLTISDDSLVGYWKLDDGNGGTAKDSSGRGNNGTLTNMETGTDWVTTGLEPTRFFNQSVLDFDGGGDYVTTADIDAMDGASQLTIAAWIKRRISGAKVAVAKKNDDNNSTDFEFWSDGNVYFAVRNGGNAYGYVAHNDTNWHHVAMVFDGTKSTNATRLRAFIDGVPQSLTYGGASIPGTTASSSAAFEIGRLDAGNPGNGFLDDVRVYNRPLSASEIQSLYNGYPHTGSGIYSLGSPLNVSGSLLNYTGELRTGNAYPITASGNWLNMGQFTSTGTVYLRGGSNQTMSGNTVFQNLDITSNGRNRTIFMDHSSRQSASGVLVLQGTVSNTLTLRSTRTGSAANLLVDGDSGTQTVEYVNARDNDASGGSTIVCYTSGEGCTDSGNNTNWTFFDPHKAVTGTFYSDEGITPVAAGKKVSVSLNGGADAGSGITIAGGQFRATLTGATLTGGTIMTIYSDDNSNLYATTVTLGSGSSMTGMHLYQDRLITRSDSGSHVMTNARLAIADNNADTDISALYLMADSNATLQVKPDKELYVWSGDTFTPGGRVKSHDVEVKGTLAMGTNGLTVSGSLVANAGTLTTSTGVILRSFSDGPGETLSLGNNVIKDLTISDDSLVGYWKLDDGNGGTAKDSSGRGNNATLTNMETGSDWTTSSLNGRMRSFNQSALDFDESSEYLTCNANDFPTSPPATIATWVYFDADQGGSDYDYVMQASVFGGAQDMINMAREASTNKLYYVSDGTVRAGPVLATGQWLHVALVFVSNTKVQAYVNGTAQTIDQPTSLTPEGTTCYIGRFSDGGFPHYIDGKLDDLRLYKRALSASEIANLYNGYPHTGSGIYSLGSKLNVSGSLLNYTGELRTGNAYPITLSGNLLNLGQFTSTGTVYLRGGTNQTMSGNTVFGNLNATSNGRTRSIFFDHSSRQNASGSLVLQGTTTNPLSLRSTRSGSGANLLLDGDVGSQTIDHLTVKDNDASGGSTLVCYALAEVCTDSGNNTNWLFTDPTASNGRNNRGFILLFGP